MIERQYKQVAGVADDSGFGGTVMQYQWRSRSRQALCLSPHCTGRDATVVREYLQCGRRDLPAGRPYYYVRGFYLIHDTSDTGNVVVGSQNGVPNWSA